MQVNTPVSDCKISIIAQYEYNSKQILVNMFKNAHFYYFILKLHGLFFCPFVTSVTKFIWDLEQTKPFCQSFEAPKLQGWL